MPSADDTDTVIPSLFENYNKALHQFLLRRLNSIEDAAEMAQEVYLRVIQYSKNNEIKHPRAFIFKTARNLLKDHARRQETHAHDQHISTSDWEIACPYPSPEEVIQSRQTLEIISKTFE